MKIDAFAHISPIRYLERVERILAGPGVSAAVREHGPWLREDPVLFDLDARWRALEPFDDYRQVLVLAAPPLEELGAAGRHARAGPARERRDGGARARPRPLRRLRRQPCR